MKIPHLNLNYFLGEVKGGVVVEEEETLKDRVTNLEDYKINREIRKMTTKV